MYLLHTCRIVVINTPLRKIGRGVTSLVVTKADCGLGL